MSFLRVRWERIVFLNIHRALVNAFELIGIDLGPLARPKILMPVRLETLADFFLGLIRQPFLAVQNRFVVKGGYGLVIDLMRACLSQILIAGRYPGIIVHRAEDRVMTF